MPAAVKYVLIPDKFKGSLSATQVRDAVSQGLRFHDPHAEIKGFAASDGGDGFLEAIRAVRAVEPVTTEACDALGRAIRAEFLYDPEHQEAFVEMAVASGMAQLDLQERDPLVTTTRGTGIQIREAIGLGARKVFVGLGGSATTDGGTGIAHEFGFRFLDGEGKRLEPVGGSLEHIRGIEVPPPGVRAGVEVLAVNDVTSPLWGPQGAAHVYGPQKGADPEAVEALDRGLRNLDRQVQRHLARDTASVPGAGAAGGTAYGLQVFLDASFVAGTSFLFGISGVEAALRESPPDYLITGEGRIDEQSLQGKVVQGALELGKRFGIPVLAVCGRCDADRDSLRQAGLAEVIEVSDRQRPLAWNMEHAFERTRQAVAHYFEGIRKQP